MRKLLRGVQFFILNLPMFQSLFNKFNYSQHKNIKVTRMHSSRMRTAHGSSRARGGLPQCMLGYTPWVWAWRPPWVWAWRLPSPGVAWRPPWQGPSTSPQVWAWRPPWPDPSTSPWVWAWTPPCCKACWDTTPRGQNS